MGMSHPLFFALAVLAAVLAGAATLRRAFLPRPIVARQVTRSLIIAALIALTLAAGGPYVHVAATPLLAVMVDLSPSTRGATYRTPSVLARRIEQLAGSTPNRLFYFADRTVDGNPIVADQPPFAEMPCRHTVYGAPLGNAVLLFSDGRFPLPKAGPPTFPFVDPSLDNPIDAAVVDLAITTDSTATRRLVATVRNNGKPRTLTWTGTTDKTPLPVPSGTTRLTSGTINADVAGASLNAGDAWPENDSLSIRVPPLQTSERWWVGSNPPPGWRAFTAADLPDNDLAYIGAAAVVLNNVSADSLSPTVISALDSFVRELGGGLVLLGGDHAFAAGNYAGTGIDALSPLACVPPAPTARWIVLADGSGSMAELISGRSSWKWACDALIDVLRALPGQDTVSVGCFARDVIWWAAPAPARSLLASPPNPPDGFPNGPTNLMAALQSIAATAAREPGPQTQLILLSDAQVTINNAPALAQRLVAAHVRVNLLALAAPGDDNPVVQIVHATHGSIIETGDAAKWAEDGRRLAQTTLGPGYEASTATLHFAGSLAALPARPLQGTNRVWPRPNAEVIADLPADAAHAKTPQTLGAAWHAGGGRVAALGAQANRDEALAMADLVAAKPADSRLKTSLATDGPAVTARLDSADASAASGISAELELTAGPTQIAARPLVQNAPGIYEARVDDAAGANLATIQVAGRVAARLALPTRYAPEFDAIGNDTKQLSDLAIRTGGRIITPQDASTLDVPHAQRDQPLTAPLFVIGAALLAAAMIAWKRTT
jgi:hypothetical protein